MTKRIDSLFKKWDNKTSPGYAIGVVRNDSLIYAKGYGMANLEYGVPITPETIFHMASVSKQFTAFSIILLARQGKLNLDDDIRKYLPWFPDLKQKITVRNLLTHTSGIRDQWQLLAIAGTRLDDVITQDQIVKVLSKQQALNFKPGDEWSYSNSGFTMLAEIVKSVTGKTLRQFTDSAIFKPLGMTNTHFHDDYTEIVPNRAYSYEEDGKRHYSNDILSYSNDGATSLFTNVDDMSKWLMNFYDHKVGDQKDIQQLTQKAVLNNGKVQGYAMGIAVDDYRGYQLYSHGGADAGYRTFVGVLPEVKMGFIVFCNLGDSDPQGKARQIADLFIPDHSPKKTAQKKKYTDQDQAILADTASLKLFMGDYISDDGIHFGYRIKNKKLYWVAPNGNNNLLVKAAKDTFEIFSQPEVKFSFSVNARKKTVVDEFWPNNHRLLVKYDTTSKPDKALLAYTGKYYCPELDCSYSIVLKDHHLVLTNAKYDDTPLKLYGDDLLHDNFWWMDNLSIVRNAQNKITGFEINSGRVMHVWFKKAE
ncbi:MAG TPA: serine hydrolase domain-containing protein [Mucilaginibacter sp.]|nr:serine hydrolase domain-containing protein [Mucilaginibacter sp.]